MCFFGHSLLPQAARCGEIDDDLDIDELLSLLAQKRSKYKHIWRDFKLWVAKTQAPPDQIGLEKVRTKTTHEIAACQPDTVSNAFDVLEEMMTRLGLMKDGVILQTAADRILICDEKGFSSRSDSLTRRVTTHADRSKTATAAAVTTFEHITVCTWMAMAGEPFPPGVVVPFKSLHPSMQEIWEARAVKVFFGL